jgi:hypothetical protein
LTAVEQYSGDLTSYLHVNGAIPVGIPQGSFVSLERQPALKIYGVGFQPAKSIPELPRWFFQKYGKEGDRVLEPFAGSGTTILEAILAKNSVHWLDYQPLSRLICQVKTTKFDCTAVLQETRKIVQRAASQDKVPETIEFANRDFWFQTQVQEALSLLKSNIRNVPDSLKSALWLIFSLTVRKVSNMNDGMILAARRASVEEVPIYNRYDVYKYFQYYAEKVVEALYEWSKYLAKSGEILELASHDARRLQSEYLYDAIVTSPPYINAIDYVWASKFELHWLELVQSDADRLRLYSQEIGTERIPPEQVKMLGKTGNATLDTILEEIYYGSKYQASKGQNQLRSRVTYKYFCDMQTHFQESFAHLKPGGFYCFSIGDVSKICGVEVPVADLLTDLACEVGFRKIFDFHLLLKNRRLNVPRNVQWAGTIKHDSIIVLEKSRNGH